MSLPHPSLVPLLALNEKIDAGDLEGIRADLRKLDTLNLVLIFGGIVTRPDFPAQVLQDDHADDHADVHADDHADDHADATRPDTERTKAGRAIALWNEGRQQAAIDLVMELSRFYLGGVVYSFLELKVKNAKNATIDTNDTNDTK